MILPVRLPHAVGAARRKLWVLIGAVVTLHLASGVGAVTIDDAQQLLLRGDYPAVIAAAEEAMTASPNDAEWPILRGEALGKIGRYKEARSLLDEAVDRNPVSLRLRLASYEALQRAGAAEEAKKQLAELDRLGGMRSWAYRSPADRVAMARVALLMGTDPKQVM